MTSPLRVALLAVACGCLAATPWLIRVTYSRGYDFFLWIYNAWFFGEAIADLRLPNWSSLAGAGQPFFKISGLSDCVFLALVSLLFGTVGGVKVFVLVCYLLAALGAYRLALHYSGDAATATVAAAAYSLSWFLTITVYFQGYLSNFMIYALLPWFAYLYHRSVEEGDQRRGLVAGVLLCVCITANPQVAIKVVGFSSLLLLMIIWSRRDLRRRLVGIGCLIAATGIGLSLFNVVSALGTRAEVLTMSQRTNSPHAPWELFLIPLYGLNFLLFRAFDLSLLEIPLRSLRFSGYPGLSVLLLASLSLWWRSKRNDRVVPVLSVITVLVYCLYWFVLPLFPASSWIGISHNLLVFPALSLAILCAYGTQRAREQVHARYGGSISRWVLPVVLALTVADLGGASLLLNRYGVSQVPPDVLPETGVWKATATTQQGRFFTYNPDHTVYLYPVLTGKPTANVVDLRQRSAEYQSYLTFLVAQLHEAEGGARPSELLALLNADLVDVPAKAYTYRRSIAREGPYELYENGLRVLAADPGLAWLYERPEGPLDTSWERQGTSPDAIYRKAHDARRIAQTVYRNRKANPGFIPERVIAIVGDMPAGERQFERIAGNPWFTATAVGYLLIGNPDRLGRREVNALEGQKIPASASDWSPAGLEYLYAGEEAAGNVQVQQVNPERVKITLSPVGRDRFLFLAQQHFRSWHAYGIDRASLPTFKAAAGLTAIFVPAGTDAITYQYELPATEKWARLASLLGVLTVLFALLWKNGVLKRISTAGEGRTQPDQKGESRD